MNSEQVSESQASRREPGVTYRAPAKRVSGKVFATWFSIFLVIASTVFAYFAIKTENVRRKAQREYLQSDDWRGARPGEAQPNSGPNAPADKAH